MSLFRQPAERPRIEPEVVLGLRGMEDDLGQRVVLDDPAAREILRTGFGLAPRRQRVQTAEHDRIAARQLQPLPRILGGKAK